MGSLLAFARGAVGFLHGEIVAMVVGGPCGKCVGPSVGFLHGVILARGPRREFVCRGARDIGPSN